MEFYRWRFASYREKTLHLDPYQDGCYRRLIDEYMATRQPLPDNDYALARICGISFDDWMLRAASIVRAFFKHKNGKLYEQNCDEELDFQDNRSKFRSTKAKKAADVRHSKNKKLDATSIQYECLAMPELRVKSREREEKKDSPSLREELFVSPPQPKIDISREFEEFYGLYPRHVSRQDALKAFTKARKGGIAHETIIAGTIRYAAECRGKEQNYIAHPSTWLNAGRWDDAPGANKPGSPGYANAGRPAAKGITDIANELIYEIQNGLEGR